MRLQNYCHIKDGRATCCTNNIEVCVHARIEGGDCAHRIHRLCTCIEAIVEAKTPNRSIALPTPATCQSRGM